MSDCGHDHSDLMGGPSPAVIQAGIETFRAMVTLRMDQISSGSEEVDGDALMASVDHMGGIATAIMFFRHAVNDSEGDDPQMVEEMREMLFAIEVAAAVATLGPMLLADHIAQMFAREWTPQDKFAERWANEVTEHIPQYVPTD